MEGGRRQEEAHPQDRIAWTPLPVSSGARVTRFHLAVRAHALGFSVLVSLCPDRTYHRVRASDARTNVAKLRVEAFKACAPKRLQVSSVAPIWMAFAVSM